HLQLALEVCRAHAEARIELPWAYFTMGFFQLLLERPYAALESYAKGIERSLNERPIESAILTLENLQDEGEWAAPGVEWARRLLRAGAVAKRISMGRGAGAVERYLTCKEGHCD